MAQNMQLNKCIRRNNMRKAMAILILVLVLSIGVVNVYSASNIRNITSTALSADDSKKSVDTAPNADDSLLDISTNKGME